MSRMKLWLVPAMTFLLAGTALAGTVTVLVKKTKLRKRPAHYARSLATVKLGDKFESSGERRGWHRVSFKGRKSYRHKSAVTVKTVSLGSAKSVGSTGTTAEEVTLAGKGFNAKIEFSNDIDVADTAEDNETLPPVTKGGFSDHIAE